METVEIIVFLTITVIIGGLVVLFVADIDDEGMYQTMSNLLYGDDSVRYQQVDREGLARAAFEAWRQCGQAAEEYELLVTYQNGDDVDRERLVDVLRKYNLCHTLQYGNQGCGSRNDIIFDETISPGSTVALSCDIEEQRLRVEKI